MILFQSAECFSNLPHPKDTTSLLVCKWSWHDCWAFYLEQWTPRRCIALLLCGERLIPVVVCSCKEATVVLVPHISRDMWKTGTSNLNECSPDICPRLLQELQTLSKCRGQKNTHQKLTQQVNCWVWHTDSRAYLVTFRHAAWKYVLKTPWYNHQDLTKQLSNPYFLKIMCFGVFDCDSFIHSLCVHGSIKLGVVLFSCGVLAL